MHDEKICQLPGCGSTISRKGVSAARYAARKFCSPECCVEWRRGSPAKPKPAPKTPESILIDQWGGGVLAASRPAFVDVPVGYMDYGK